MCVCMVGKESLKSITARQKNGRIKRQLVLQTDSCYLTAKVKNHFVKYVVFSVRTFIVVFRLCRIL